MPAFSNSTSPCSSQSLVHSFNTVLGQWEGSIWRSLPLEGWKQQQQQACWWGGSILFVKVNPLPTEAAPGRGARQPRMSENTEHPRPSPRLAFQARRQPLPRGCHCRVWWFLVINQQLQGQGRAISWRANEDNTSHESTGKMRVILKWCSTRMIVCCFLSTWAGTCIYKETSVPAVTVPL